MELQVPSYYIVTRVLPEDFPADAVRTLLSSTPPTCSIVSRPLDAVLARSITDEVLIANSDGDAITLAEQLATDTQRPVLVVGEAECLDAIYPDGRREKVC